MRKFMTRGLAAVVAASTVAAGVAMMGSGSAGAASQSRRIIPLVYTKSSAGYFTSGMRFRFVATKVKIPARQKIKTNNGPVWLSLYGGGHSAKLFIRSGGGAGSISYDNGFGHGTVRLSPHVGNILRLSVYRDRATSRDQFVATNTSTGRTRTVWVATPPTVVYQHASIRARVDDSKTIAPPDSIRLWSVKAVHITSYSGVRGSIIGQWSTSELIDTVDGTSGSNVVLFATNPSHHSQNFGIWLSEFPH
jgi:hypothetical protein